jgi:Protein of unknown function (DUF2752)
VTTYANAPGTGTGSLWRRLAGPGAAALTVGAATLLLATVNPNQPGHYPMCPLKATTGLDCPGCGGLRCVHDLATGHPAQAANQNLLAFCLLPAVVGLWFVWLFRRWRGDPRPVTVPPRALLVLGIVAVAFAVVRNLPFVPYLRSGLN